MASTPPPDGVCARVVHKEHRGATKETAMNLDKVRELSIKVDQQLARNSPRMENVPISCFNTLKKDDLTAFILSRRYPEWVDRVVHLPIKGNIKDALAKHDNLIRRAFDLRLKPNALLDCSLRAEEAIPSEKKRQVEQDKVGIPAKRPKTTHDVDLAGTLGRRTAPNQPILEEPKTNSQPMPKMATKPAAECQMSKSDDLTTRDPQGESLEIIKENSIQPVSLTGVADAYANAICVASLSLPDRTVEGHYQKGLHFGNEFRYFPFPDKDCQLEQQLYLRRSMLPRLSRIWENHLKNGALPDLKDIKKKRRTNSAVTVHVAAILMYQFLHGSAIPPHNVKEGKVPGHLEQIVKSDRLFHFLSGCFLNIVLRIPLCMLRPEKFKEIFGDGVQSPRDFYLKMMGENLSAFVKRQVDKERKDGTWCEKSVATTTKVLGKGEHVVDVVLGREVTGLYFVHKCTLHQLIPTFGERRKTKNSSKKIVVT